NIEEKYPVDSHHKAKVRNFTNFGVFVELEEGVDGLIHISDLSWTKKIKHPAEFTNIGEDMEVVVLEVDKENRRLSLGHKQLEENPWEVFETIFNPGSIHEGTITELTNKGAVVSLPYGVEGFATPKHLVKEDGTQAKADEKLNFKVVEFNKDAKKIFVSHSRIHEDENRAQKDEERKAKRKAGKSTTKNVGRVNEKMERTTLGDVSGLAKLKEQMEEDEKASKEEKMKEAKAKLDAKEEAKKADEPKETKAKAKKTEAKSETKAKKAEDKKEDTAEKAEVKEEKSESKPKAKAEKKDTAKAEKKEDDKEEKKADAKTEKKSTAKKTTKKSTTKSTSKSKETKADNKKSAESSEKKDEKEDDASEDK
ncbi:MAG TPA: S1 RNA-binding domain-containing protein, partial [Bacteroidales bacterium]|nr:S1 RNA-binding domain-containing protein [Bacteroidales bacterium]